MNSETIALYLTRSGKEGARVKRYTATSGRISFSWIGAWGAGSGANYADIRKSVETALAHKRGWQVVTALPASA